MANRSKKPLIVEVALSLFLAKGYKGTSIDAVVKASGVSKPTVYNHFPDKSDLFMEVVNVFIVEHKVSDLNSLGENEVLQQLKQHCLHPKAVRLIGIVLVEGFRFRNASQMFMKNYVQPWLNTLEAWQVAQAQRIQLNADWLKAQWFDSLAAALLSEHLLLEPVLTEPVSVESVESVEGMLMAHL